MEDWEIFNSSKIEINKPKTLNELTWTDFVVFDFLTLLYRLSIIMFVNFASPKHHGVPGYLTEFHISG